ncbi:Mitochondrial import receptor subunit tom22 [Wickerhamiella sorbophila]|uniref:Mitochondrial import receptor subunit tom22 n=1 Tax=Wickerhamiella sorbophila TaxID=45607 RepID=A0A2T0FH29_9ASCO|nr:Mitochondrial import receptor subunit tom22 [Wickerhamiella sorbophila]PRT54313.1 Mitochondrial import receptor subunit tom22 [Wickerhamiella sorbophila]
MVKVELVEEDVNVPVQEPQVFDDNASNVSDDVYDDEDEFDINETLAERVAALKDVIPPQLRAKLLSTFTSLSDLVQSSVNFGGKSLWVITSSTLLLGVPLSLCILSEQQLMEMEKGMQLGDPNSVLAPEAEAGVV